MAVYGVTYPNYPDYDQWEVHDESGGTVTGSLSIPVGQTVQFSAPFDRGFFCVAKTSAKDYWSVYKTDLISGSSSIVHEIGEIGESDTYDVFSLTVSPSGEDVLIAYTSSTVGGYPLYLARSTDYGDSWSTATKPTFTNLNHVNYITLFRVASNPNVLYHSDGYDDLYPIYRSYDNGATWSANINTPPGSTTCAARMPSVFLNYDKIILVSYTYSPALEYVYTLDLPTGVIHTYLISDDGAFYAVDNNRHNTFGSYCRLDSQPPAETTSHGSFQDPPIFITEAEVIFHSEASPLIDTVKTQWQDVRSCFTYPAQKINGKTKTNSYIALNRNGFIGIISPRPSGNPYIDFFFDTGDEKLYGVSHPAAGLYPVGTPATWAVNDINGLVSTGELWEELPIGYNPTVIYNVAPFDRGFYTLSKDDLPFPDGYIYRLRKTLVLEDHPVTTVVYEIADASYSNVTLICSKDGAEVLISCAKAAPNSKTFRSYNYGEDFYEFSGLNVTGCYRFNGLHWPQDLFATLGGDEEPLATSSDFAGTWNNIPIPASRDQNLMPSSPMFVYTPVIIQQSWISGPIKTISWMKVRLVSRDISSVTDNTGIPLSGNAVPDLFAIRSFGCVLFPPNHTYAAIANPPILTSQYETVFYNDRAGILESADQGVKDCYGFAMDKVYGCCRGSSTVTFNEDGSIGLAPPIVGDFLIHLSPTYSQFFTAFIETVETSLKPE
jgi:hypothetical protein